MIQVTPNDWTDLQNLASRVGLPTERVGSLRRRLADTAPQSGRPYILLVGRPNAGIEVLLARWFAPEVAEALQRAACQPLVIGPRPAEVRPDMGTWPTWTRSKGGPGHLIVLRTSGMPDAGTLAQLSSLGYCDQVVLVTRLGQPLHLHERDIARSLASVAATVRVLVIGFSGEEHSAAELTELSAYAVSQMRQAGFRDGRCLGAGVWFTDGKQRPGTLRDIASAINIQPDAVANGRASMAQQALANLFKELRQLAEALPASPQRCLQEDERHRLSRGPVIWLLWAVM